MKLTKLLALTTALSIATFSAAKAEGFRPYVGVDFGGMRIDHENTTSGVAGKNILAQDFLYANPHIGVDVHKNLALELGYFQTTSESKNFDAGLIGGTAGENAKGKLDLHGVNIDAIGKVALNEKVSALGVVGAFFYEADEKYSLPGVNVSGSGNDTALKLGGGLQYDLTNNIAARSKVEYVDIADGLFTYNVGLQYRFQFFKTSGKKYLLV